VNFAFTIYTFPLFLSALVSGGLMIWSYQRRTSQGIGWFALLMFSVFVWAIGYFFELNSQTYVVAQFWAKIQYLTVPGLTVVWLVLVLIYTGQERYVTLRNMAFLLIIPTISVIFAWTNDYHQWLWINTRLSTGLPFNTIISERGWWYWVNTGYIYTVFMFSTGVLIVSFTRSIALYRRQISVLLVFSGMVFFSNVIYVFGNITEGYNISPMTFSIGGLFIAWGLYRYRVFNIMPIANDLIVDVMEDAVIVLDVENRILNLNPAGEKLTEHQLSDAVGLHIQNTTSAWEKLQSYFAHQTPARAEIALTLNGQPGFINLRVTPIFDKNRHLIGRLAIVRDITARKQAEAQLHVLSRAVEESATTVVITDADGAIEYANPAFSKITGYTREEAIGQNPRVLKSGKHPAEYYDKMWQAISSGHVWRGDVINKKKNGELYWEASTIAPVHDENGKITHYVAVKADITERKKAEEQLRIARDKAVQDSLAKTQMLANVSHELRTPLGAILGFSELFQMGAYGDTTPKQDTVIEDVIKSAHYIIDLVDDLLDQARVDANIIKLNTTVLNIEHLIRHIESKMKVLAEAKQLTLTTDINNGVPSVLLGDELRLQQIIINLLNNAIKFTESGSIKLKIKRPNAHQWVIEVSDTGIGIPKDQQNIVFDAFRQVDENSKTNINGVGLGLSIVKKLVSLMNGEVSLESEAGKGSTFRVLLPLLLPKEPKA